MNNQSGTARQGDRLASQMVQGATGAPAGQNLQVAEKPKAKTFDEWMSEAGPALKEALPAHVSVERFSRMILTNYKASPKLQECTIKSVLGSALQAAQIGLQIGILDQAYLVPYRNWKGKVNGQNVYETEAQLIIGYKGYIELGMRTGKISFIDPQRVYKSDEFEYEYGSNSFLRHKPKGMEKDDEIPTHYYVGIHQTDGKYRFLVRSYAQILRHARKFSDLYLKVDGKVTDTYNTKSNWYKNFDSMALKTVIRELFKTVPLSPDISIMLAADETIKAVDPSNDRLSKNMAEEVIDLTHWETTEIPPGDAFMYENLEQVPSAEAGF